MPGGVVCAWRRFVGAKKQAERRTDLTVRIE
jgi:hypothetical protein